MTRTIKLTVNDKPVTLDYFVQGFVDHTTAGMLAGLEGTGTVECATLQLEGNVVMLSVNDAPVAINDFVQKIIGSTLKGMLLPLKGVEQPIKRITLNIQRNV